MSGMSIRSLFVKPARGTAPAAVQSLDLSVSGGIKGDCFGGDTDRQVCLISGSAADALKQLKKANAPCAARFSCNMVVDGLDGVRPGALLHISQAVLRVTQAGRACHGLCADAQRAGCVLVKGVIFARVEHSGTVHRNDTVRLG